MPKVMATSPFSVSFYQDLIQSLKADESSVLHSFLDSQPPAYKKSFFFRHDIDTQLCVQQLPVLLQIDEREQVPSASYFRVDQQEYSLAEAKKAIRMTDEMGFEVGLHTVCYVEDDVLKAFEEETKVFSDLLGKSPRSFTIHGLGDFRKEQRREFIEKIQSCYAAYGYKWSDALKPYPYKLEIQDCNWNADKTAMHLYEDFITPPLNTLKEGEAAVILTHPCYWQRA